MAKLKEAVKSSEPDWKLLQKQPGDDPEFTTIRYLTEKAEVPAPYRGLAIYLKEVPAAGSPKQEVEKFMMTLQYGHRDTQQLIGEKSYITGPPKTDEDAYVGHTVVFYRGQSVVVVAGAPRKVVLRFAERIDKLLGEEQKGNNRPVSPAVPHKTEP